MNILKQQPENELLVATLQIMKREFYDLAVDFWMILDLKYYDQNLPGSLI